MLVVWYSMELITDSALMMSVEFHQVVWHYCYGVAGIFIYVLSEILSSFQQWKNFENRLGFCKVTAKIRRHHFFETE